MERAKLIVKNFGPLKNIEIEVRPMVTLIGAQASGKSTLAKLISIFEDDAFRENTEYSFNEELAKYNILNYLNSESYIYYHSPVGYPPFDSTHIPFDFTYFKRPLTHHYTYARPDKYFNSESLYIPTERTFLHLIAGNTLGLINNDIKIPKHLLSLGQEYEKAIHEINELKLGLIDKNIQYKREGNNSFIYHDEAKINLLESASGIQTIVPILLLIEYSKTIENYNDLCFVIEEPELNLYPKAQHELVKYLIKNCISDRKSLVLTTHSPFVLASINNLLLAFNRGQNNPSETRKILNKESWLNPNDFIAYELKNGKARKIMDDKLGQIKDNMIDNVSDFFSDEFDKLLDL